MINKKWLILATNFMALAIIIGAFTTHGLKNIATPEKINALHTASLYMIIHALALCILFIISNKLPTIPVKVPSILFRLGIYLFSVCIMITTLIGTFFPDIVFIRYLHYLPPVGGLCFIFGWLYLSYQIFKLK